MVAFFQLLRLAVPLLFTVAGAVPALTAQVQTPPASESKNTFADAFYNAPDGFQSATLGSILRYRAVPKPIALASVSVTHGGAWQVLYRTQNSVGEPEAALMTIIKPVNAKKDNLFSLSYFTVCTQPR